MAAAGLEGSDKRDYNFARAFDTVRSAPMCFSHPSYRVIRPILALLMLAFLISASAAQKTTPQPPPRPNLLLVTIDTLRPDHLRCYGYTEIETPSIDSLAAA